ncbi:MAG: hypothetical protein SFX18_13915 [Pirellulales bacterium]|nr:hypothetical protein [Pirellulales bacterium]
MNKAFVREPEPADQIECPRCELPGTPVSETTFLAHASAANRQTLGQTLAYCPNPHCIVGYFDSLGNILDISQVAAVAWPKDPAGPLCACFDFTWEELQADLDQGTNNRVRALLAESQGDAAHCQTAMPDGQCCHDLVQRTYLREYARKSEKK